MLPLYEANEFRTSDHDPVIIGLEPNAPPTVDAGGPYSVTKAARSRSPQPAPTRTATPSPMPGISTTTARLKHPVRVFVSLQPCWMDPSSYTVKVRATDPGGLSAVSSRDSECDECCSDCQRFVRQSSSVSCGTNNATLNVTFTDPGCGRYTYRSDQLGRWQYPNRQPGDQPVLARSTRMRWLAPTPQPSPSPMTMAAQAQRQPRSR